MWGQMDQKAFFRKKKSFKLLSEGRVRMSPVKMRMVCYRQRSNMYEGPGAKRENALSREQA